jgi:D-3-phosphoglycerate dehydrogenase
MTVLGTSRRKGSLPAGTQEVPLQELFARSDAVVVCCALTDETRGLVDRDLLARMQTHAVLVNVSRGAVIETTALIDTLRSGKIAGAALDVFDVQPLPPDDALFDCPDLLLTPHTAGITATSSRAMAVGAAEEMLRILRGEQPLNLVNPGYKAA